MKLPITRETTGWATSATRSHVSCPCSPSSTFTAMALIASSWSAIRLGVKPRWNSAFSRSCLGGSMPMNIACASSSRKAGGGDDHATGFGGIRLPVAADGVHVLGSRNRPEAGLVGKFFKAVGPMHGALAAHLLEGLERRPIEPQLAVGQFHALDIAPDCCHGDLQSSSIQNARRSYWLRGQFLF